MSGLAVRLGRFTLRHRTLGKWLHRAVHRGIRDNRYAEFGCWLCRGVWASMLADVPDMAAGLAVGHRQMVEHRTYEVDLENHRRMAHPDWPVDDLEQPDSPRGVWVDDRP